MAMTGSNSNSDIADMTPYERRERIRPVFALLAANQAAKQQVREALNAVWVGGLYDGDTSVNKDCIAPAQELLRSLDVDGIHDQRRQQLVLWLSEIEHL